MDYIISEQVKSFAAAETSTVKFDFDLDNDCIGVQAIAVISNKPNQIYHRGSMKLSIGAQQILPENYPTSMLVSGINVPPDERFKSIFELMSDSESAETAQVQGVRQSYLAPNSKKVNIEYTDTASSIAAFSAYNVVFIIRQLKETRS